MENHTVIVQFDYDENYATVVDLICFNLGVDSGKYFRTIKDAHTYLTMIDKSKEFPDIAIITNYLGRSSIDGEEVAKKLKIISPDTTVIAYTEDDEADWGDHLALKSGDGEDKSLITLLEKLTKTTFNYDNSKEGSN